MRTSWREYLWELIIATENLCCLSHLGFDHSCKRQLSRRSDTSHRGLYQRHVRVPVILWRTFHPHTSPNFYKDGVIPTYLHIYLYPATAATVAAVLLQVNIFVFTSFAFETPMDDRFHRGSNYIRAYNPSSSSSYRTFQSYDRSIWSDTTGSNK